MSSVVLTYQGRVAERAVQDSLLEYLGRLAVLNAEAIGGGSVVPRISELLSTQRSEGLPARETIEWLDDTLRGRIAVRSDVMDRAAFDAGAAEAGLSVETMPRGGTYVLVPEARVRGIDFRLFDPRRLYPGEDRLSFVFLEAPGAPFLDGRLVKVTRGDDLGEGHPLRGVCDWQLECPYIHLRYVLEEWTQLLLCWARMFLVPELTWQGYEDVAHWESERPWLESMVKGLGAEQGREASFGALVDGFGREAAEWTRTLAQMRVEEDG